MRKPIVAANWKMNGSRSQTHSLLEAIKHHSFSAIDVVILPSFVFMQQVEDLLTDTKLSWGAQNFYLGQNGAFTGEISASMLIDFGCQYVLVGHSERRMLFHEDLTLIAAKFKTAIESGLQPILCVGETLAQREKNETEQVIKEQITSVIKETGIDVFRHAVIAYEPVWAIGTGRTATPEQAQEVHKYIRNLLSDYHAEIASHIRIIYGGSVKADNAAGLFAMPDIDGGLVGGASLDAKSFITICDAATLEFLPPQREG